MPSGALAASGGCHGLPRVAICCGFAGFRPVDFCERLRPGATALLYRRSMTIALRRLRWVRLMLFDWLGGWHKFVVGDRESGCLQEGARDFDRVSEIAGHPETQSSERQLDQHR